jgi:hypothetical protein
MWVGVAAVDLVTRLLARAPSCVKIMAIAITCERV